MYAGGHAARAVNASQPTRIYLSTPRMQRIEAIYDKLLGVEQVEQSRLQHAA